jgi:hypothetical protein
MKAAAMVGVLTACLLVPTNASAEASGPTVIHSRHPDGSFTTTLTDPSGTVVKAEGLATLGIRVRHAPDGTPTITGTIRPGRDPRAQIVETTSRSTFTSSAARTRRASSGCGGRVPIYTMGFSGNNEFGSWNGRIIACPDAKGESRVWGIEKLRMSAVGRRVRPQVVGYPDTFWVRSHHFRHRQLGFLDWRPLGSKTIGDCKDLTWTIAGKTLTLGSSFTLCHGTQHPMEPVNTMTNSGPMRGFGTRFEGSNFRMKYDRTYAVANTGWVQTRKGCCGVPWRIYRRGRFMSWHIDFDTK